MVALLGCERPGLTLAPVDASGDAPADIAPEGPSGIGRPCSDERERTEVLVGCRGGQVCYTSGRGFPGGYCSQDCFRTPCPGDAFCVAEGSTRYCLRRCLRDEDCRASEGYVCGRLSPVLPLGCIADPSPVGTAPDGGQCSPSPVTAPDAGEEFAADPVSVSRARDDSVAEVNPVIAVSPVSGSVVVGFVARSTRDDWFGASARNAGMGWGAGGAILDFEFNSVIDPALTFDREGVLHAAWLGISFDRPSPGIRTTESRDGGATWGMARAVEPSGRCAGGCDPPSLAVTDDGAMVAAYVAHSTRGEAWVVAQRGTGAATRFGPALTLGAVERAGENHLVPATTSLATGPSGRVAVAWVLARRENTRSLLGDVFNGLRVAVSSDGGRSFAAAVRTSREAEPVVAHDPALAWTGTDLHALYVTGEGDGRWDLALATTRDAGAHWAWRRVASDPPRCATHGWVALAADPAGSELRALWIDNRSGDGAVWSARCPSDPGRPCGANERVSAARFALHTGSDPARWHGTRSALVRGPDGALHAAWSDTRSGGPAVYVARGRP